MFVFVLRVALYTLGFVDGMTDKKVVHTRTPQNIDMLFKEATRDASLVKIRCHASSHVMDAKGQASMSWILSRILSQVESLTKIQISPKALPPVIVAGEG